MVQIYDDNYAEAFALESYFIEEAYNQHKILLMLNEAVCLESGDFIGLRAINESFVDGVKNFFSRLGNFVKKIFTKFRERMGELFTTDKAFLKKYEKIITGKPFKAHELTDVSDYAGGAAEDNIKNLSSANFGFDAHSKSSLYNYIYKEVEYTEENFVADILKKIPITKNNTDLTNITDINDYIKGAVQGETVDIKMNRLDPKKLYTFCANIDATINQLNKNEKILNTSSDKILTLANKLLSETEKSVTIAKTKEKEASSNQPTQDTQPAQNNQQESKEESVVYSRLYNGYITEAIGKVGSAPSNNSSDTGNTNGSNAGQVSAKDTKAANNLAGLVKTQQDQNTNGNIDTRANTEKDQKTVENMVQVYENFYKYCVSVQANLLTVTMAVYKDYIKLLRVHVRDYVATSDDKTEADHNQASAETPSTEGSNKASTTDAGKNEK